MEVEIAETIRRLRLFLTRLMRADVFPQVRLTPEPFVANAAGEGDFAFRRSALAVVLTRLFHQIHSGRHVFRDRSRFVPPSMRRQVCGAVENLIAFRTSVLDVNYSGTPMLSQRESILVHFLAKPADVVADFVFDFGQLGFRLFRDFDQVESRIYVAFSNHERRFVFPQLSDDRT